MGQIANFGVGFLTLIPAGSSQPIQVGILKDVSIDISFTLKSLIGNMQFPVDVARGEGKITGKAKTAQINSALVAMILSGAITTTGNVQGVYGEGPAVPVTNTITAANGATFKTDLGVYDVTAGKWLSWIASAPATGQYSVNATTGVYTFAAADATHLMSLYYSYTVAATGATVTYSNQLMGANTTFALHLFQNYSSSPVGGNSGIVFPATTSNKLSMAFKNSDHTETDFDFECFADATGKICYEYVSK